MNAHKRKNRMLACAVMAMMLVCCFAPIFASGVDATDSESTIHMRVGDNFSYTPTTNLTSTITGAYVSGSDVGNFTFADGTLSGTPTKAGNVDYKLTAQWSENGLSQTATQTIHFVINEKLTNVDQDGTGNVVVLTGAASGDTVFQYKNGVEWTGPSAATVSCVIEEGAPFVWDAASSSLKTKAAITDSHVGEYTATWTVSFNDSYAAADVITYELTITVGTDLAISSDTTIYTYVGEGEKIYKLESTFDEVSGATVEKTMSPNVSGLTASFVSPNLTYDAEDYVVKDTTKYYDEVTIPYTLSGTYGSNTLSVSGDVTLRIYASLAFTTSPTVGENVTITTGTSSQDVMITTTVSGATSMKIYWGDGTSSVINTIPADNINYSARHVYDCADKYVITVVTSNVSGDTRASILYDASGDSFGDGSTSDVTGDEGDANEKSFVDKVKDFVSENGYFFIILIVAGVILALMWAIGFRDPRILGVAAILIVAGVISYFMGFKPF